MADISFCVFFLRKCLVADISFCVFVDISCGGHFCTWRTLMTIHKILFAEIPRDFNILIIITQVYPLTANFF